MDTAGSSPEHMSPNGSRTGAPRHPRKYTIRNQRQAWTAEEHKRFLEGIRLFKRNWSRVTAHVGTRTVVQIRSHAQKHFIKLKRQGQESLIPPRRNKDRREAESQRTQSSRSASKRRSSPLEEKQYVNGRESKKRPVKRIRQTPVKPVLPADRYDKLSSRKSSPASSPSMSPTSLGYSRDMSAGIQALLLLSRG
ncbi:hypothetical protein AAMO2058_000466000 [Amorphochlora amoebiformis]|uniref:Uncharacterized protein n=1 Tax=Amorphochlora amoebiformis TaxID=1561963 RepID=A0A6T6S7G2_9EUKA|mmetsp:Transcript_12570/g.19986  ORF Transcript_12570/g.19986 Transcript_12570/m.19986 type:complete len:194 (+) Transcript_12570:2-583(+)